MFARCGWRTPPPPPPPPLLACEWLSSVARVVCVEAAARPRGTRHTRCKNTNEKSHARTRASSLALKINQRTPRRHPLLADVRDGGRQLPALLLPLLERVRRHSRQPRGGGYGVHQSKRRRWRASASACRIRKCLERTKQPIFQKAWSNGLGRRRGTPPPPPPPVLCSRSGAALRRKLLVCSRL